MCYCNMMSHESSRSIEDDSRSKELMSRRRRIVGKLLLSTAVAVSAIGYGYAQNQKIDRLQANISQINKKNESQLSQIEGDLARLNNTPIGVVTGSTLNPVPSIKGNISEAYKKQSEDATVEVLVKLKGTNSYSPICTGNKVSDDKYIYILLANHCLEPYETPLNKGEQGPSAVNITNSVSGEFFIAKPSEHNPNDYKWQPISKVNNIAVDRSGLTDLALMQVVSNTSYQSLPAVPLSEISTSSTSVNPGEAVSLYALPKSSNFAPASERGVYLGRFLSNRIGGLGIYVDLVGINPSSPTTDACEFGASGSTARFANGLISGPLSFRNNLGYGKSNTFYIPDNPSDSQITRFDIEEVTGDNLNRYSTICGYSVPINNDINGATKDQNSTIQGLEDVLIYPNRTIYSPEGGK